MADVSLCLSSELFHEYPPLLKNFLGDPSSHLFFVAMHSLTYHCVFLVLPMCCPCFILSSTHCVREYQLATLSMWMNGDIHLALCDVLERVGGGGQR